MMNKEKIRDRIEELKFQKDVKFQKDNLIYYGIIFLTQALLVCFFYGVSINFKFIIFSSGLTIIFLNICFEIQKNKKYFEDKLIQKNYDKLLGRK